MIVTNVMGEKLVHIYAKDGEVISLSLKDNLIVSFDTLVGITGTKDIYRLDSELDHMRSIELLVQGNTFGGNGGFTASDTELKANITPSPLALNLYYRTHTTGKSPIEFWEDTQTLSSVAVAKV